MTAIWTPSKELWTPKHPAFRRRVSEWCRMAAGAVSTCGGKVNTKNGKVSTNAGQTGGCGCGPVTCAVSNGTYPPNITYSGLQLPTCESETGSYVSGSSPGTLPTFSILGGGQGLFLHLFFGQYLALYNGYAPLPPCSAGDCQFDQYGYPEGVTSGASYAIATSSGPFSLALGIFGSGTNQEPIINGSVFSFSGSLVYDTPVPNANTSWTLNGTVFTFGIGGTATATSTYPTIPVSEVPTSLTIQGFSITQSSGTATKTITCTGGGTSNAYTYGYPGAVSQSVSYPNPMILSSSFTYCPGSNTNIIGALFTQSSGPQITWGVSGSVNNQWVLFMSTAIANYYCATPTGTYVTDDPNQIPQTITVT